MHSAIFSSSFLVFEPCFKNRDDFREGYMEGEYLEGSQYQMAVPKLVPHSKKRLIDTGLNYSYSSAIHIKLTPGDKSNVSRISEIKFT